LVLRDNRACRSATKGRDQFPIAAGAKRFCGQETCRCATRCTRNGTLLRCQIFARAKAQYSGKRKR